MTDSDLTAPDFATAIDRLLRQVRHWEQPRWSSAGRADRVFQLIQLLADLTADTESRPRRQVPRQSDTLLPDQLRVMADDLLAAAPSAAALTEATTATHQLRNAL